MNTKAEVENSPIFKIIKKATMRKYPWIKDMYIRSDEDIKKYSSMLFIDITIDAQQLAEERGWTLESWVNPNLQRRAFGRNYANTVYLSIMFKPENSDEAMALQNEVDADMKRIQNSGSIPDEYKIDKTFGISDIRYNFPPPDNTTITN
jgi:hypothetical protein